VIYTASDLTTLAREVARTMARGAVSNPAGRTVTAIDVSLSRVLDLTDPSTRDALGVEITDLIRDGSPAAREIGEAANYLGFEAIIAPSATGDGFVVAIFVNNRAADSQLVVVAPAGDLDE
jgi:RES domain-containing protein